MEVLDSTALIDLLRGENEVLKKIDLDRPYATTQINMYELIAGFYRRKVGSRKFAQAMALFKNIRILSLNDFGIIRAAEISASLWEKGLATSDSDCLIAGIMLSHNVSTIITKNTKHFSRITGLKVEGY